MLAFEETSINKRLSHLDMQPNNSLKGTHYKYVMRKPCLRLILVLISQIGVNSCTIASLK